MQLGDVMTKDVRYISSSDRIIKAARLMREINVGSIPVLEGRRLVGLLTDRDIVIRCLAKGQNPSECLVNDHMSTDVVTASPSMTTEEAMRLMADRQIRRLPILDEGRLVGMVTLGDLAVEGTGQGEGKIKECLQKISEPIHQTEQAIRRAA